VGGAGDRDGRRLDPAVGELNRDFRCHEGVSTPAQRPRIPANVQGRKPLVDPLNRNTSEHWRMRGG
jgi:hypothetical protein